MAAAPPPPPPPPSPSTRKRARDDAGAPQRVVRQRLMTDYAVLSGHPAHVPLKKVISGGQSGADRAGLHAARAMHIATGGWAPPGYVTVRGRRTDLATEFGLREVPVTTGGQTNMYVRRSMMNVDDSDGTIAFYLRFSRGTGATISYCRTGKWNGGSGRTVGPHYRPCLVVSDLSSANRTAVVNSIVQFVTRHRIQTLNVAGHRSTSGAGMTHFYDAVRCTLMAAFWSLTASSRTSETPTPLPP